MPRVPDHPFAAGKELSFRQGFKTASAPAAQQGARLALNTSCVVRVQKPETMLADAMSEMRVWLEHKSVQLLASTLLKIASRHRL